jgi:hypothetical protein
MARSNGRSKGQPSRAQPRTDGYGGARDTVMAMGRAERKAQTLADTPSEFAPPGDNPYRVSTVAPPVDAPRAKMARGSRSHPLI